LFLKYLHDALPKSEIPLVQEMMGYMLVALNKAQKAFIMLGKPDSGKSTLDFFRNLFRVCVQPRNRPMVVRLRGCKRIDSKEVH